jgi:hypothetical protein
MSPVPCVDRPADWFPTTDPAYVSRRGVRPRKDRNALRARREAVKQAITLCRTECPIRRQCADTAVKTGAMSGIWAGYDLGEFDSKGCNKTIMGNLKKVAKGMDV